MRAALARLVKAALAPLGLRLWYRIGSDPNADISGLLGKRPVRVVVDGGAYVGHFSRAMAEMFPGAQVHAFELTPDSFSKLVVRTQGFPAISAHRMAIGSAAGETELFMNSSPLTNSLRRNSAANDRYFGNLVANQTSARLPVTRLDDFCAGQGIDRIDVLKRDLQGNELDALVGLGSLVDRLSALLVELQFVQLSAGAPFFSDIDRYMRDHGCGLYQLYEMARNPSDGRLLYADALFVSSELLAGGRVASAS